MTVLISILCSGQPTRREQMAYSEKVIDHYEHPRNVGAFDKQEPDVGTGMVGAPACGDARAPLLA